MARYRSLDWYRRRIRTLDERNCTTAAQLQATLDELVELHVGEMRALIARAIMDGFIRMRNATPQDTGRAMAGWQMGTDESVLDFVPPVIQRPKERGNEKKEGKKKAGDKPLLPEYAAMIRKAIPSEANLSKADVLYIVNNVEYIMMLEAGWSRQAPRGFIGNFLTTLKRELNALASKFGGQA